MKVFDSTFLQRFQPGGIIVLEVFMKHRLGYFHGERFEFVKTAWQQIMKPTGITDT